MSRTPTGYTRLQIALHWIIFLLIAVQFLFHDGMEDVWRAVMRDTYAGPTAGAILHVAVGLAVLALVVIRLGVKLKRGSPLGALRADGRRAGLGCGGVVHRERRRGRGA